MVRPQPIVWQHEPGGDWTAIAVGTVHHRVQYELHTAHDEIRGSHTALGSAQAQLSAWYSWLAAQQP